MTEKLKKSVFNNILPSANGFVVKEELEDNDDYLDDKMCISETTITGVIDCAKVNQIKQHEICIVDYIKTESSPQVCNNMIIDNVKREDEVYCADDIKIKFDSGLLFCNNCKEIYQDYCTKCQMLVHVLNPNTLGTKNNGESEKIPKNILEIRQFLGNLGIFALNVIPKGVQFGPFTGLSTSGNGWRLKDARLVVNEGKSKFLNWMRYINPARSISKQNLLAFRYDNNLYYRSICKIQVNEELLVSFGEEHDENLNKDIEVDFIPTAKEDWKDVFACTFCCIGFSSKTYLSEHKTICSNKINGKFLIEELSQCEFCKIFLDKKEYIDHHMSYCRETSGRGCVPLAQNNQTVEVRRDRRRQLQMHKCTQCSYRTTHKGDLKNHTNQHYEMKIYPCRICKRRFKMKKYLKMHVENAHNDIVWDEVQNWFRSEYITGVKAKRSSARQDELKQFGCSKCDFHTKNKYYLARHIKWKHLKEFRFKCEICKYQTNRNTTLERHIKTKHLKQFDYKCGACKFKTNINNHLEMHMKTKHLNEFRYKCEICDFQTYFKPHLEVHIKSVHLKKFDYKCEICKYETNRKTNLEQHIKTKHLKEFNYECEICKYKTNRKTNLDIHIKSKHLKEFNYKCNICDFKTNLKPNLEQHIKTKHLKEFNYKCQICKYGSNRKSNLEQHIKTKHLKEFNYNCEICKYKTNGKTNLEIHIKTKHLKEFTYKCEICKYKTNLKSSIEIHIKTKHLKEFNYKCETCMYKTNRKINLDIHIKSKHFKEFNYKCGICKYKTNRKTNLQVHIKTKHLKEFNYKCDICDFETNLKPNLEQHIKTKHLK